MVSEEGQEIQTYHVVIEEATEADQSADTETIELPPAGAAGTQNNQEGEGDLVVRTEESLDDTISVSSMPALEDKIRKLYQQVLRHHPFIWVMR